MSLGSLPLEARVERERRGKGWGQAYKISTRQFVEYH